MFGLEARIPYFSFQIPETQASKEQIEFKCENHKGLEQQR